MIIFIVAVCICLLMFYLAIKGHTASADELKLCKSFVEKMMKDVRVLDKYGNPIRNIDVLDKISGSFNMSNLKIDLGMLYYKSDCINRLTDDKNDT